MIYTYAQNLEDALLQRVFADVENGFYIDIGAQHPTTDSISRAFYDLGWRGINVEPVRHYADMLRAEREGDVVIEAAVSNRREERPFYEFEGTGLSTLEADIGARHQKQGYSIQEVVVPTITMDDILQLVLNRDVHWLKIDVEGHEQQVLEGWTVPVKPWVLMIESTLPLSQVESHRKWQPILRKAGYKPVYFDGLNRFFVHKDHASKLAGRWLPPNVFDDIAYANDDSPWQRLLQAKRTREVAEARSDAMAARSESEAAKEAFEARLADQGVEAARQLAVEREKCREEILHLRNEANEKEKSLSKSLEAVSKKLKFSEESLAREQSEVVDLRRIKTALISENQELRGVINGGKRTLAKVERTRIWKLVSRFPAIQALLAPNGRLSGVLAVHSPGPSQDGQARGPGRMNMTNQVGNKTTAIPALEMVLSQHDERFVEIAYKLILGRKPDPDGGAYYLDRLREGESKIRILADLRRSPEGKLYGADIPGLDPLIARYIWNRRPIFGPMLRAMGLRSVEKSPEQRLRCIENMLVSLQLDAERARQDAGRARQEALQARQHALRAQRGAFHVRATGAVATELAPPPAPRKASVLDVPVRLESRTEQVPEGLARLVASSIESQMLSCGHRPDGD